VPPAPVEALRCATRYGFEAMGRGHDLGLIRPGYIADLLLVAKIKRQEQRIAVIANRVKRNTIMYRSLMKFLYSLQIPVIATLRAE
jgi:imidazolonepropionase-like amidohydrolase